MNSLPGKRPNDWLAGFWSTCIGLAVILAIWWITTSGLHLVAPFRLPSPEAVLNSVSDLYERGELVQAVTASLWRMFLGWTTGSLLGVTLGLAVGINRYLRTFFSPLVTFFQAMAGPVWIPIAVLWFGLSSASVAFIVFNTVFFLVFYGTLMGVRTTNPLLTDAVRVLGGSRLDVIREVAIPGAVGGILFGLSAGIGYGWRTLIAGEIIASGAGLGVLIWEGQRLFRIADIFVGLLLIGVLSLIMKRILITPLESWVARWGVRH
jgi:taurine transport system permease protein